MPNCLLCNAKFPFRVWIDGKQRSLQRRKYCLDCSPFGAKNTRILDPLTRSIKGLDITDCVCQDCGRNYVYRKEGPSRIRCNSCSTKKARKKGAERAYQYKGSNCVYCGYNRCTKALHFHHMRDKEFEISSNMNRNWQVLQKELDKCVLLCSICHVELHEGLISDQEVALKESKRRTKIFGPLVYVG